MDAFTLFQLQQAPILLSSKGQTVTLAMLKDVYVKMQTACHPDMHATAGVHQEQRAATMSAAISQAYKVLSNHKERVKLWLQLQGLEIERQTIAPDMQAFELQMHLNEMLEQSQHDKNLASELQQELQSLQRETMAWFENYYREEHSQQKKAQPLDNASCLQHYGRLAMIDRLQSRLQDCAL